LFTVTFAIHTNHACTIFTGSTVCTHDIDTVFADAAVFTIHTQTVAASVTVLTPAFGTVCTNNSAIRTYRHAVSASSALFTPVISTFTFPAFVAVRTEIVITFLTMFKTALANLSTISAALTARTNICGTVFTFHTGITESVRAYTIDTVLTICAHFIRAVFAGFKAFTTDHRAFIASISAAAHVGTIPTHSAVSAKITGTIPANTAGSAHFI
jgi:hypothetical protein